MKKTPLLKTSSLLNSAILLSGLFWACCYNSITIAASEMDSGLALFAKKDYKHAIGHFGQALKNNPKDYNALYYQAVTFHQLKELDAAKAAYHKIVKEFPDTPAASNAHMALMYLDPVYARAYQKQMAASSSAVTSGLNANTVAQSARTHEPDDIGSDLTNLPDQVRVPYQREGQNFIVTTYLNGRPIDMYFDSGAEGVVIRKSELESLGIKPPSGQHFAVSYGVGDGGGQKTWLARVSLKVGQLERKNFPLHVQEDPPSGGPMHPLLGQTFFRDFSYTLDPSPDGTRGTILFQKKNSNRAFAANDSSVIPFSNMGKDMLVTVEINGRKIPMIFDTGAEICCFTKQQFRSLGLSIPDDAQQGFDQGIAGITASARFTVPRMQLGPIIKNDISVSVVDSSNIPYPLLGNSFLHDLRIDIDNDAHQMRVRR